MATSLFKLVGSIFVDSDEANKSIAKTDKNASGLGATFGKVAKGVGSAATAIVGGAAAIGGSVLGIAQSQAAAADEIDKLSERTGINREELQRWMHAADQSGVSSSSFTASVKKMSETLVSAKGGSEGALKSFEKLGINLEDFDGLSVEEQFSAVVDVLAEMEDGADRNALGAEIFGKAYTDMLPMLNAGKDGIADLKNEADALGIVMSEDSVKAGVKLGDTIANVKAAFDGLKNQLGAALLPLVQALADLIVEKIPVIQSMFSTLIPIIVKLADSVLPPLLDLVDNLLPVLAGLFEALLPVITELMETLLPVIITLFTDIVTAILPPLMELIKMLMPYVVQIIEELLPLLVSVLDVILPLLTTVLDLLGPIIEPIMKLVTALLPPLVKVITFLLEPLKVIIRLLDPLLKPLLTLVDVVLTPITKKLEYLTEKVFPKLKEAFKGPLNFIIEGLNVLVRGLNKLSFDVPDWVPFIGGKTFGFNIPEIPKLKKGINYVPYDEYPAVLHEGERVLTAEENRSYSGTLEQKLDTVIVLLNALLDKDSSVYMDGEKVAAVVNERLGEVFA